MKIGFLGAGTVAQTLSRHLLLAGHSVVLSNSRGPESLKDLVAELGSGASAGTPQEAADQDFVVLAVGWQTVQSALSSVPDWTGRTLVDATNRIASLNPFSLGDISGRTSSEIVADLVPGANVIKAFNTVPMGWISDTSDTKPQTALFLSGDHNDAKRNLSELLESIGFACLDLGSLSTGGRLQQLGGPLAGVRLELTDRFAI